MDELLSRIQHIQTELNRLIKPKRGWCTKAEVLALSQQLDEYINEYHSREMRRNR